MLHTSGYQSVTRLAQQGPIGLGGLVSALCFLGFIPPVAILGTIALVSFAGAIASPRSPDPMSGGAA